MGLSGENLWNLKSRERSRREMEQVEVLQTNYKTNFMYIINIKYLHRKRLKFEIFNLNKKNLRVQQMPQMVGDNCTN